MEELLAFSPPAYINNPHLTLPLATEWFLYKHDFNDIDDREYYEFLDNRLTTYARQHHSYILELLIQYENDYCYDPDEYGSDEFFIGKVEIALLCDYIENPRMIDWIVVGFLFSNNDPERKWHHPRRDEILKFKESLTEARGNLYDVHVQIKKGMNFRVYPPADHPYWNDPH